ncbi:MAG: dihydropteroate synthase [Duncaniella sp.]|uniref:dihydropteroate synthase n=1 Tax=Duncaniella sp. TaxID=2518496 RepID=UPI0023D64532|nr:dihydropteroate synthase [Duncaniella sp.]MDE6089269.1 dihydropteroate synthase [Duncaniella sp.]
MFQPFSLNIGGELREYSRPQVMGIINVTPDSFFKISRTMDEDALASRIERFIADGADFIDMGAYSSRPGAADVDPAEEIARLRVGMKVLRSIDPQIPVSIDTFRSEVARVAIEELGANIVNDISGGSLDQDMFRTVARLKVPYILMHMRGTPATMQSLTDYSDVTADVIADLSVKLRELHLLGVADVVVDPGFGFSKTTEQNFEMMRNLQQFEALGCPLLVGISRKSMITRTLDIDPADALAGTVALDAFALTQGAAFLRVHDVLEAVQTVKLFMKTF